MVDYGVPPNPPYENPSPSVSTMPSQVTSDRLLAVLPEDLRPQAAERLTTAEPVLRRLLAGLYGDHAGFDAWLGDLMASLGKLYAERAPELRALDLQRVAHPD